MKKVKKKEGRMVTAYCLGKDCPETERIRKVDEKHWRIFSREAKDGELACEGDYVKFDSNGLPYPNSKEFFLANHRHIEGDTYEQIPRPLRAWDVNEEMCPEIQFIIEHKGLKMDENSEEKYFSAPLEEDVLSAAKDAIIIFYEVEYDSDLAVRDAMFYFIARDEFEKIYDVLGEWCI